jgi:Tol biopolymer transport system component
MNNSALRSSNVGRAIVALLAAALCLACIGCSGGSSAAAASTPTSTPAPTPTPNPTPTVTGISPSSAPAGALTFTLTVTGSNFLPSSMVQWDGSSRTTTVVSATQLKAQITAADLTAPGKVTVTVVNPSPGGGNSNTSTFTIAQDAIAFVSDRDLNGSDATNANLTPNIWVINTDGSNPTPLTELTAAHVFIDGKAWSPDGSKLAFDSTRALNGNDANNANLTSNIWVVNADGSNPIPLTNLTAAGANSIRPVWSPDGSKVAFASARALDGSDVANGTSNIWVMNADGSDPRPLTNLTTANADSGTPIWSPDGSKIAFSSARALNGNDAQNTNNIFNVWVVNADGSNPVPLTKLTDLFTDIGDQAWSPDGGKIAFSSGRALNGSDVGEEFESNIWVMNADGSQQTPLTLLTALNATSNQPAWSPDGSKILFASVRALDGSNTADPNGTINIWVMKADGSSAAPVTRLTAGSSSFFATWSPDGSKILFESSRPLNGSDAAGGQINIWVVNTDGSNPTPLTQLNAAFSEVPVQQP